MQLVELLLDPILQTFGPISVRLALDRMPRDCWWPLDREVRTRVDQEARREMVLLVKERKQQQQQRSQVTSASVPILHHRHSNQEARIETSEEVREVKEEKILEEGRGLMRTRLKFGNPWKRVQKWVARDHDKVHSEKKENEAQSPAPKAFFRRWNRVK